jgi:hypothetical protein
LEKLKASGIRLAFLSDFTEPMLDAAVKSCGFESFFGPHLSTDNVRAFKPAPRAYQMAVDAFRLQREEIVFAAFAGWDAAGARSFGFPPNAVGSDLLAMFRSADSAPPRSIPAVFRPKSCLILIRRTHNNIPQRTPDSTLLDCYNWSKKMMKGSSQFVARPQPRRTICTILHNPTPSPHSVASSAIPPIDAQSAQSCTTRPPRHTPCLRPPSRPSTHNLHNPAQPGPLATLHGFVRHPAHRPSILHNPAQSRPTGARSAPERPSVKLLLS